MGAAKRTFLQSIEEITLWIIEDNDLYRDSICNLLNDTEGMRCEHALTSVEEALKLMRDDYSPEVILMDIELLKGNMDGIEGTKRIKAISRATDVIILTNHEEDQKVFNAICAGANGYLLKNSGTDDILSGIREVLGGGAPMNAQIAKKVLTMFTKFTVPEADYNLTKREKEILRLCVDGLTKKQIAEKLFVAFYTIDTHMKNIYEKMQVHSRSEAVAKALKERLL